MIRVGLSFRGEEVLRGSMAGHLDKILLFQMMQGIVPVNRRCMNFVDEI